MTSRPNFDVCIVGAGLIGLAVGRALVAGLPGVGVAVVDKEEEVAVHQSGHNSGVVHSGLYYQPGSLKARLCVSGRDELYAICEAAAVPIRRTGKLVVATRPDEIPALEELERRGRANGLDGLARLGPDGIREVEPNAAGLAALHVHETGVADYPALARHFAGELRRAGAEVRLGSAVVGIDSRAECVDVMVGDARLSASVLVNCAGLQSDRVAKLAGVEAAASIVPFRGEYYAVAEPSAALVRNVIYPVPDPRFPFLGVHFTRRVDGTVEVGPNAVLALGREHYRGVRPDVRDIGEALRAPGLWRLGRRHWRAGLKELARSRSRHMYASAARRLLPGLRTEDLVPGGAGVRAQAINRDGTLADDFIVQTAGRSLHVLNAPSPGATACTAIGRHIAGRVSTMLGA